MGDGCAALTEMEGIVHGDDMRGEAEEEGMVMGGGRAKGLWRGSTEDLRLLVAEGVEVEVVLARGLGACRKG